MTYVVVLPFRVREIADACLDSCKLDNVVLVDNTDTNLGIMRANNHAIDYMRRVDADWLVLLSAAVVFGDQGGLDFADALEAHVGAATVSGDGLFGWHLFAISREAIDACGRFDENFTPYGFDDIDYAIRLKKTMPGREWVKVPVDADDSAVGMAHGLKVGGVYVNATPQITYLQEKWGGERGAPFEAYHDHPFDDPTKPVGWWPTPWGLGPVDGAHWDLPVPWPEQVTVR